jgi:hypothetical protein
MTLNERHEDCPVIVAYSIQLVLVKARAANVTVKLATSEINYPLWSN